MGNALAEVALFGLRGQLALFGMMAGSSTVVASKMTSREIDKKKIIFKCRTLSIGVNTYICSLEATVAMP